MRQHSQSVLENPVSKTSKSGKRELLYEGRKKNLYYSDQELISKIQRYFVLPENVKEDYSKITRNIACEKFDNSYSLPRLRTAIENVGKDYL